jgi:hypothetical protein
MKISHCEKLHTEVRNLLPGHGTSCTGMKFDIQVRARSRSLGHSTEKWQNSTQKNNSCLGIFTINWPFQAPKIVFVLFWKFLLSFLHAVEAKVNYNGSSKDIWIGLEFKAKWACDLHAADNFRRMKIDCSHDLAPMYDRSYETWFRPKTFQIHFHPQLLEQYTPKQLTYVYKNIWVLWTWILRYFKAIKVNLKFDQIRFHPSISA